MNKLLVIYYHEVVDKNEGYSYQKIEKDKFEEQMKYLADHGYHTLFFSELGQDLPEKPIIVSFDDGFRTVYENAASIMRNNGIRGNIYLPTKYISCDEHFMTWNMVKELYRNGEFEMQAHTHSHVDIRMLSEETMRKEIEESSQLMSSHLGYTPQAFCMPFGTYDERSIALLKKVGRYDYYLGSFYGRRSKNSLKGNILPRIGISNDDSLELFVKKLNGEYDWKGPLQQLRLFAKNLKKERITNYEY